MWRDGKREKRERLMGVCRSQSKRDDCKKADENEKTKDIATVANPGQSRWKYTADKEREARC